uniref:Poly(A) RNA polymerase mitochondrial-like central palm domain-containing protein n=1 Tax=Strombidium rassoulzadegani TaxID=1082188 RepID=A0A7S3CH89_9SPIT|mmetsp:Transcript_10176/g.17151  ORF Transcript_10176/g.17151 Transcript_10176/m.17151 type:complete len:347 (+) Transcript_10176:166-1206(+)
MCEKVFHPNSEFTKYNGTRLVPKLKQFGSMITGLALETSDMDLAVTNLNLPDRDTMIQGLELLSDELKSDSLIKNLHAITTAAIPVIKAEVDLNQLRRESLKEGEEFEDLPESLMLLKIDITFDDNLESGKYDVDDFYHYISGFTSPHMSLTQQPHNHSYYSAHYGSHFQQKSHQGLASCKLIKHYVEKYRCLKEVAIVMKQFLAKMGLNQPYLGGLSSYSTVLLIVAYMNRWSLQISRTLSPARLLMGFLDYFSYYFKVELQGIDVTNGGSFFDHPIPETNFVILDPINDQDNNTSKNSYMTRQILQSFRMAFNTLKQYKAQYINQMNPNITDNLLSVILETKTQ